MSLFTKVVLWVIMFVVIIPGGVFARLEASFDSPTSVTLKWIAPGDDGSAGTATTYDIRYSTVLITETNWDDCVRVEGEPTPQIAGSSESFTVYSLNPSTTYYFAIKTADEVPNWSLLSNVISIGESDLTPPGVISDFKL